jgi:hypothetical protein
VRTKSISCNVLIGVPQNLWVVGPTIQYHIRSSWHANQGLPFVEQYTQKGSDLLGADVMGCPTTSLLPSPSTPGRTPLPTSPPD